MSDFGLGGHLEKAYATQSPVPTNYREPTIRERIGLAVEKAQQQLADAQRMAELFDKNPDLEELINLMNKGRV